jgi:hypothetical protein
MKQVKFLATMSVAAGLLFLYSCKSGEKKAEEPTSDTTTVDTTAKAEMPAPAAVTSSGPTSLMTIKFKVANFAKWKPSYEGNDSFRLASGLHKYLIARGIEDSNMVMVIMRMDDVDKAKQFAASPGLKARMKKGGVIGPPTINYETALMNDTTAAQQDVRLLVRHKVKDWDAWKKVFDSHKQARMDAGLTDRLLAHAAGDDHDVSIVFTVADVAKAKAFVNSKDLKDKMKEGGVEGAPTFWFYRLAEKY